MPMKREIIKIDERGGLNIPTDTAAIWMTETELAELFGAMVPTINAAIQAIYKSDIVWESEAKQCIRLPNGNGADAYNLEMIVALAFRLNSRQAGIIRKWLLGKAKARNPAITPVIIEAETPRNIC